ncbi:hypothetical protein [Aestuariivita sp.]|uniref:hypothetical protein n=1 Tax=Aestuariivita sp. TaxID=1872407 RepID=UPI00217216ED|nr:hypothetical protein [Aestuariivita sp.]MCE8005410.1 hypothetical protein [Aestuariivita sp.]
MGTWKEKLNELVAERWAAVGKPVFLSQARPLLKKSGLDLPSEAHSIGVKDYLEIHASDFFQIVRPTDDPKDVAWALAPKHLSRDEVFKKYEEEKRSPTNSAEAPRFHKAIWSAFHIPKQDQTERYLNLTGKPSFLNVESGNEAPEGWSHIPAQYLHSGNDQVDRDVTEKNLRRWFEDNQADIDKTVVIQRKEAQRGSQNDFFLAMSRLSERDLSRISVPLDLVVKLLGK